MTQRIVSLIASATEIVAALGCADQLVGRSHECDFPPGIQALPQCSQPGIDVQAGSAEIDRQVRAAADQALSIYNVSIETLQQLQPTLILTQTQCNVCAVSLQDVETALAQQVDSRPQVLALESQTLSGVWQDIRRVADTLGVSERGEQLVASLQARLEMIHSEAAQRPVRPSVLCLEWIAPLMAAGNWGSELVEIAGGQPVLSQAGAHSPAIDWADLQRVNPDVIVLMACGFDLPRTASELPVLFERPEWFELRAVRQGRVYLTDGTQFFNRPGPRLVESAEILSEILPDLGGHGPHLKYHGTGWLRMEEC